MYTGEWITISHNIRMRFVRYDNYDYVEIDATDGKCHPIRCSYDKIQELNSQQWGANEGERNSRIKKLLKEVQDERDEI